MARLKIVQICVLTVCLTFASADIFPLSIIHINDFHARYEATDTSGGNCDAGEECIGGYARTVYTVKRLLEEQKDKNPIFLNAGDNFQGTLWYNIGRWKVTSEFLNMLPADAITLGNHEFDHGVEGVVPFLESIKSPILVANMDARDEPTMQGKYANSIIIERSNRKIGIIGIILETTYDLANTGDLIFLNESATISAEAKLLREQGANIIIAITHCGYDVDKLIAQNAGADVDVIVGSHSHTFLFTGDTPPGPDTPRGDYPTEVIHESGHRVLIVQAAAYAKYVGNIRVFFDDNGDIVDYEGAPIYMGSQVPEDLEIVKFRELWKDDVVTQGNVKVGESRVELNTEKCSSEECNLGNFYTDAMLYAFLQSVPYTNKNWSPVSIVLTTSGELQSSLHKGDITRSQVYAITPFEGTLIAFKLKGTHLLAALEHSMANIDSKAFLQVSGLKLTFNLQAPVGQRVVEALVRCAECEVPKYEPLEVNKDYRILATRYVAYGAYGYDMFKNYGTERIGNNTEFQAIMDYLSVMKPIITGIEGRIKILKN